MVYFFHYIINLEINFIVDRISTPLKIKFIIMNNKLLSLLFLAFISQSIFSQDVSNEANTDLDSFIATDDDSITYTSGPLYNHADYVTTSSNKYHQAIYNNGATNTVGRVTIKSQYKRHQKKTAITGASGEIITIKMKFKTVGTLIADNNVFLFGLKSLLDATNTVAPVSGTDPDVRNGEWATVHVDTDNKLNLRFKTNLATEAFDDGNTCYVTLKYFIGDSRANSRIKMKLENGASSSGWVNQSWTSQLLYDALTGSGAYIIFSSEKALGTTDAQPQIYIDDYEFTTSGDSGLIQLGTNDINAAAAWSTGSLPTSTDRLFIFDKTGSFINSSSESKTYDYVYIDEDSKLTINAIDKLTINELDNDGQLDVESAGFIEGNVIVGSYATNAFDENITLDDAQSELTVASGGLLLRQTSMLCSYYTPVGGVPGPYWDSYDGSSWSRDAAFPDGTTDYSGKNLVYSTQAHSATLTGTNSFNDVYILDGKKMIIASKDDTNSITAGNITVENIYAQDASDAESGIMYTGSSLIVNGTSSANITYKIYLGTNNWYLVSSPVVGETYDDAYVTANSIASGTQNPNSRGIAPYVTTDDSWDYMQAGETTSFSTGTGYSVKRTSTGNVSFTGTINVDDDGVDVVLSSAGNRFNLLGNPYTSLIASATFLNQAAISETQTLWVWNQASGASGAYEVKTIADAMVIAPAQGFFVKANAAGGTFNFAESNQASSGGTFQRTEIRPEIYLTISDQTEVREAKIYYIENMTTGFDVGYEGELFNGVSNPLAIFTHLVSDSEGKNYQLQSLPTNNYENMIIPVGINAVSGTVVTIDASTNNFPEGINIYLEDKQDNSFTLLDDDSNFSTSLEDDLSGIGSFYLHTTTGTLSTDALEIHNNISIYKTSNDNLRVTGVQNGSASIQIYNILGKQMMRTSFEGMGVNDISLPTLPNGVYIIKLGTQTGTTNKKIIF